MTEQPAARLTGDEPLVHERRIGARPETVFRFLVDPEQVVKWMGSRAQIEPRPGGTFRLVFPNGSVALGEVVAIEPPKRLVFTWGWEGPEEATRPGSSTVEVVLEPDGEGTHLRLTHSGLVGDARETHAEGWESFLARLVEAIEGDGGGT